MPNTKKNKNADRLALAVLVVGLTATIACFIIGTGIALQIGPWRAQLP